MSNAKYLSAIETATETKSIDFKAAMHWINSSKCERFEILKDIAAMANAGGGYIIFGRDEPDFKSGSLDKDEMDSFDPTKINQLVHRFLSPKIDVLSGKRRSARIC